MAAPRKVEFSIGAIDRTRRVLRRIASAFRRVSRSVTGFRALVAGVIAGSAIRGLQSFAESLENIQDTATALHLTTEQFQALKFAAEEVGLSGRDVETTFQRLDRRVGEARDGNAQLIQLFESLGIKFEELDKLGPTELFDRLAAAMRRLGKVGEARIARIADTEGLRFLKRFVGDFQDFGDALAKAKAAGAIIDPKTLRDMEAVAQQLRAFGLRLVKEFAPVLLEFINKIRPHLPAIAAAMTKLAKALLDFIAFVTGGGLEKFGRGLAHTPARVRNAFARGEGTAGGRVIGAIEDVLRGRPIQQRGGFKVEDFITPTAKELNDLVLRQIEALDKIEKNTRQPQGTYTQ